MERLANEHMAVAQPFRMLHRRMRFILFMEHRYRSQGCELRVCNPFGLPLVHLITSFSLVHAMEGDGARQTLASNVRVSELTVVRGAIR